jgi:DNA-directed RNA polymerase specialized sigma24 family protein
MQKEQSKTDDVLQPFLQATEEELPEILAALVAKQVEPLVKQIVRRKLCPGFHNVDARRRQDAEDVSREAIVSIIRRLSVARNDSVRPGIDNFNGYVAVTAYNACSEYIRRKYPERHRLTNRLRYILTHQENFDLWEGDDSNWLCGLRAWRGPATTQGVGGPEVRLQDSAQILGRMAGRASHNGDLASLLAEIFKFVGRPCPFEEMVDMLADWWGLNSVSHAEISYEDDDALAAAGQPDTSLVTRIELRAYLRRLWTEICELPSHQRCALLLNVRDSNGQDIITMFVDTYVATIRQIAEALGLPVSEFVELWNELPCDDSAIAKRLGLTRQQVVSLRQSARRRLARRMSALEDGRAPRRRFQ